MKTKGDVFNPFQKIHVNVEMEANKCVFGQITLESIVPIYSRIIVIGFGIKKLGQCP